MPLMFKVVLLLVHTLNVAALVNLAVGTGLTVKFCVLDALSVPLVAMTV